MDKTKPFEVSKTVVWEAYKRVKANRGAAGIDDQSITEFEVDLKNNLFKIWNRMSSGSYFPPPVKAVEIPKKSGGVRRLGVPTVSDRIAQMTAKIYFEPLVEPHFHPDSYGYRPNKSAIDAVGTTRERCWKYNWVLEFDIKGLFDNIDHELLMKAVRKHTDCKWILLYVERWLKAPFQTKEGKIEERNTGTPQGGVISPVLSNLFLHYVFDKWMENEQPYNPFARYADDAVIHCKTKAEAIVLLHKLEQRFRECKLELHPVKTRVVYCKSSKCKENHENIKFDFLGYTFQPRCCKSKQGEYFIGFTPAVSNKAMKAMRQQIREWRIHLKPEVEIEDLSCMYDSKIRGWINYYCCFNKSRMNPVLRHINSALAHWARRKYKKLARHKKRAERWLGRIARRQPQLFSHWQRGVLPCG